LRRLDYLHFVNRYFIKNYPVEITFFVTNRCNFRCKHCLNWQKIEDRKGRELSISEIRQISKTMKPFLRLLISGGEPFLREDLSEICKVFYENCKIKHITIPTNGFLTSRIVEVTEQILRDCNNALVNVSLSLDGLYEKRDQICGVKGSFKKFEETYHELTILKDKYPNLGVGVITTHTHDNQENLKEIFEYALNVLKVDNFGYSLVRGSLKYPIETKVDINLYEEMAELINNSVKEKKSKLNFPFFKMFLAKRALLYKTVIKTYKEKKWQIPCYAGRLRAVFDEIGNVYPCETLMLDKKEQFSFGNFRDHNYDFNRIWFSKKASEIRKKIVTSKCFCRHECDLTINILFNLRLLPTLIREWIRIR